MRGLPNSTGGSRIYSTNDFRQRFVMQPQLTRLTIIFSLWLLCWAAPLRAQTANPAQIELQNVPIQDEKLLVVNVYLSGVDNLYGAEVQLHYNPAQLTVRDDNRRLDGVQISPGPIIASDNRFVVTNSADAATGLINFAFTLLKPAPPISGDGVLATVVFEITGNGPYQVDLSKAQLVSGNLQEIPVTVKNLRLDDQFKPAVEPVVWLSKGQILALAGVLGGLVLLGGLLLAGSRWKNTPPAEIADAPARKIPGSTRSTVRSAGLLAEQGTRALQQGDPQRAYELFSRAIELDPANAEAWLGKGLMAQQPTEKRICLQRVLALDPANPTARAELDRLLTSS